MLNNVFIDMTKVKLKHEKLCMLGLGLVDFEILVNGNGVCCFDIYVA